MSRMWQALWVPLLVVCALVLVVLVGLWWFDGQRSSSVLSNPDDPPCWHGICPGETSAWQAVDALQDLPVGQITRWGDNEEGEIAWGFENPIADLAGYFYILDGQVEAISIHTMGAVSLSEALQEFGEPESMWQRLSADACLEIILVYSTRGIFVRVDVPADDIGGTTVMLGETSAVGKVVYFNPDLYEHFLGAQRMFGERRETIESRLQPWPGLGAIDYRDLETE